VIVKHGEKFFSDQKRIYPMVSRPRGQALLINNEKFLCPDVYADRPGSAADLARLESLFSQLGFCVHKYENLTWNQTLVRIIGFSDLECHIEANMAIVCVSSHGSDSGKIITSDCRELDLEQEILRRFNNQQCPRLKGKPKFFIIQACRGEELDYGIPHTHSAGFWDTDARASPSSPGIQPLRLRSALFEEAMRYSGLEARPRSWNPSPKELSWEDMLIAHSTLPGYVANRDTLKGTWFIQSLCRIFAERACDTDIRDMLDLVAEDLKDNYISDIGTKQSCNYDVRHFYRKLYFNPGWEVSEKDRWQYVESRACREGTRRRSKSFTVPENSLAARAARAHRCLEENTVDCDPGEPMARCQTKERRRDRVIRFGTRIVNKTVTKMHLRSQSSI